ncbi:MAG TPA: DMT family transporter [Kofleriaceae bacterium]|nr:DMT family transporter [Kofleriaceae bacterium]
MLAYYGLLLISACGVAAAPILVRVSEVDATSTLFLRMGVALALLLLPVGRRRERRETSSAAEATPRPAVLMLGIVGTGLLFCADMLANHWAVRLTSVANCMVLVNFTPVFVIVIAYFVLRERQSAASVAAVAVAVAGAVVLVGASYTVGGDRLLGDGLALSSAFIYSIYMVLTKTLRRWVPAARLLTWHTGLSFAFLVPVVALADAQVFPTTARGWVIVVGLAVMSQLIGHGLMTFSMKRVAVGVSSMSTLVIPVLSSAMAWTLLAEPVHLHQLVGGCLVLLGVALYVAHDLAALRRKGAA